MKATAVALPDHLRKAVVAVTEAVSDADIDAYGRIREIEDRSFKVRTVVAAWERQQAEERPLRRRYANGLLLGLFAQVIAANVALFMLGAGALRIEQWVAITFFAAVFAQVASMTVIVVRYLFPDRGADLLRLIGKL